MLRSKRCRDRLIPDQVDDRAQRRKDQDEKENPKNDKVGVGNSQRIKDKTITHN